MSITGIYIRASIAMRGNGLTGKVLRGILWKDNSQGIPTARFSGSRLTGPLSPQMVKGGLTPEQLETHLDMILSPKKLGEAVVKAILDASNESINRLLARLTESQLHDLIPKLDEAALTKLLPRLDDLQYKRTLLFTTDEQLMSIGCGDNHELRRVLHSIPAARKAMLFSGLASQQLKMLQVLNDSQLAEMVPLLDAEALKKICCQVGNDELGKLIQLLPDEEKLKVISSFPTEARMIETLASKNMPAAVTDHVLGLIKAKDEGQYYRVVFAMIQKEKA